jgi:hypothetical protein
MNKLENKNNATNLITIGWATVILSNPLLYLNVGSLIIDIRNLFGASLDRQSISFNTNDPFIQTMILVSSLGLVLVAVGWWKRRSLR